MTDDRDRYKNNRRDGRVTATWPGSALLYKEMIKEIRPEDWEIEYRHRNRFAFMGSSIQRKIRCAILTVIVGNGFTMLEMDEDADLAFYINR